MSSPVTIPIRSFRQAQVPGNFTHGTGTTFDVYASSVGRNLNISFDARGSIVSSGERILACRR